MTQAHLYTVDHATDSTILSRLLAPITEAFFFDNVWEQRPEYWRMAVPPTWLLGAADLAAVLADHQFARSKAASLGRMTGQRYQHLALPKEDGLLDLDRVFAAWQEGYTLIVPELHRFWPPIALLADYIREQTGLRAEMNLYYTPANAIAFPPHYDTHDVMIVQLFGRKYWQLFASPEMLPFPEEHFQDSCWANATFEAPTAQIEVFARHVLYLPRGTIHAAQARRLPSLHLSIGLYPTIWRDLLPQNGRKGQITESELRRGVSPSFHRHPIADNAPPALRRHLRSAATNPTTPAVNGGSFRDRSA